MIKHKPYQRWTKEDIIGLIKDRVRRGLSLASYVIIKDGGNNWYAASRRLFGSWVNARLAARIPPSKFGLYRQKWTAKKVLDVISEHYRQYPLNLPPESKPFKRRIYLWQKVKQFFANRNVVRKKLGLPLKSEQRWTPDVIKKFLRTQFSQGKPINSKEILESNRFLYRAARYRYGSYRKAIAAAGLDYNKVMIPYRERVYLKPRGRPKGRKNSPKNQCAC